MIQRIGSIPVADVHHWTVEATQRLLGHTIGISDSDWHEPSPIPGWTRAHIATHLARSADYLAAVADAVSAGRPQPEPPSRSERLRALELGADRNGLEQQIDLDTSAGALNAAIERVDDWTVEILLRGRTWPLEVLPLARLHEVCVHHLDLDCGLGPDAVDPAAAAWLLRWVLNLLQDQEFPALHIEGDSLVTELGEGDRPLAVSGSDARLWAWLSGRSPAATVSGADGLQPALLR